MADEPKAEGPESSDDDAHTLSLPPKPPPPAAPPPQPKRRSLTRSFEDDQTVHTVGAGAGQDFGTLTKAPAPARPFEGGGATLTKMPTRGFESDDRTMTKAPQAPGTDQTMTKGGAPAAGGDMTMTHGGPRQQHASGITRKAVRTTRRLSVTGRDSQMLEKPVWDIGDIIAGKYEVTAIAGKGGMGVVYKIHHREWNIDMAVKTPLPNLVEDDVSRERFIREAQTWVDLGLHPNLVQCWYVRELGRLPRLFVDYMEGGSLKDWADDGRLKVGDWAAIIDLTVQAADGLGYAHDRGVVHRDVKPANMLMTHDGRLCVTDFGLVKLANIEDLVSTSESAALQQAVTTDLTMTGSSMGTPQYGAPEQWGGARHVDGRSDLYALGITLYELLCGRRPFDDRKQREPAHVLIARHLTSKPDDPRRFRADVPEPLAVIALKCLAKKPDDRYATMRDLRDALAAAYAELFGVPFPREAPRVGEARAAALNNRAVSMFDLGKPDEAYTAWHEALKLDPQHPESIYNLGLIEWRAAKTTDDALEKKLMSAKSPNNHAGLYAGYIQLESCAAAESEKLIREALSDPVLAADGAVWRSLGHAQMAQKKFADAAESYSTALQSGSDDVVQACLTLAQAQTRAPIGPGIPRESDEDGGVFPNLDCRGVIQDRGGSVHAVTMMPQGGPGLAGVMALTDGPLGSVMRWDLVTGKLIKSHNIHSKLVRCITTTPDGTYSISGSEDGNLQMWNLSTDLPLDFYGKGHLGPVTAVAMYADGTRAISGGGDKSLRIWELPKGLAIKALWGHEQEVTAVAITADMQTAVSGSCDGTLRIWNLSDGACRSIIKDGQKMIYGVCLHPDGHHVVSAGTEGTLFLYNLDTGARERSFAGHHGTVRCAALTSDGQFLISGGDDHTLRLWDLTSGRCLRTIRGHQGPVQVLALSPDGSHLFSGSAENEGRPLRIWKLEHGGGDAELYAAALQVCRVQNQLQAQDTSNEFDTHITAARHAFETGAAKESYQHLQRAREVAGYERDPRALELNAQLSRTLARCGLSNAYLRASTEYKHVQGVRSVSVSADGKVAASAGREDKSLCLWETATGKLLRICEGHKQPVEAVALTPKGDLLISGSQDYTLVVWDVATGKSVRTLDGHNGTVAALAMRADGKNVVSASADGWLRYWEIATGKCVKILESDVPACAVAISRDNRLIVSGHSDGSLRLWSLVSGKCMKTFTGHSGVVHEIAFTPDNRLIVSAGEDKTLRIWNVDSGLCTTTIKDPKARFQTIAVLPDNRYVFSGGAEGMDTPLRMWEIATGALLSTTARHAKGITSYALSADGCVLISGGEDTLRIWDLEWELDPNRVSVLQTLSMDSPRPGASLSGMLSKMQSASPSKPAVPPPPTPPKKPGGANPFGF